MILFIYMRSDYHVALNEVWVLALRVFEACELKESELLHRDGTTIFCNCYLFLFNLLVIKVYY